MKEFNPCSRYWAVSQARTISGARGVVAGTSNQPARLDVAELDRFADRLLAKSLAESTQRSYRSGQNRFLTFCRRVNVRAVPASETLLCRFVAYVAREKLKHRTIKVYLSAIRFLHIVEGAGDPFKVPLTRLEYTLKELNGVKHSRVVERLKDCQSL